jgi:hypothetical protein
MLSQMAGIRGKSGPPANQNAFKHGLAGVSQRRANGGLAPDEQTIREDILAGLIADKGGEEQFRHGGTNLGRISSDVALLVTFNQAIEGIIENNQKARQKPQGSSSTGRLQTTAGGLVIGKSPAVRDGKSRQNGIASEDYRGDDRRPWGTSENSSPDGPNIAADGADDGWDRPLASPFDHGQFCEKSSEDARDVKSF